MDDHRVEALAGLETADVGGAVERRGAVERGRDQGLFQRQTHAECRQRDHERHRRREAAAGVHVGGQRHRDAARDKQAGRREPAEFQEERRRRQQCRHHAGRGHRLGPGVIDEDEVVGRGGTHRGRGAGAAAQGQLVGVDARPESQPPAGLENRPRLLRREDSLFAEDVVPFRQTRGGHRRQHLVDHQPDVGVALPAVLDGHVVRAHERGGDRHRLQIPQPADRPQHLQLGGGVEPVAALHLAGRRALRQGVGQSGQGGGDEFIFRGLARVAHRSHDAATAGRNLGVCGAAQAAGEFVATVAAVDQVGVRVDEARHHGVPAAVDDDRVGRQGDGAGQFTGRPHGDHAAVEAGHRRARQRRDVALRDARLRSRSRAGGDDVGVGDEDVGANHAGVSRRRRAASTDRPSMSTRL